MNVRGSFLITKYSLKLMKPRNYGRILLIASIAGKEVYITMFLAPCILYMVIVSVIVYSSRVIQV